RSNPTNQKGILGIPKIQFNPNYPSSRLSSAPFLLLLYSTLTSDALASILPSSHFFSSASHGFFPSHSPTHPSSHLHSQIPIVVATIRYGKLLDAAAESSQSSVSLGGGLSASAGRRRRFSHLPPLPPSLSNELIKISNPMRSECDDDFPGQLNGDDFDDSSSFSSAAETSTAGSGTVSRGRSEIGLMERLSEILVDERDGDLMLQRTDACRDGERLKPLLKLNASDGVASTSILWR
ncbi:hypothetical protein LINPERHAP1_LOCUS24952, partial [Linum perenne]